MNETDCAQLRTTTAEAWLYAHPMLENYRTLYAQAVDAQDPRHVGGFGAFRHYSEPFTPANTDIVTPNNDTPYSWAWLDLRAEPWVVSVPATERYHVLPFHDLDTTYIGYVGSRTTGSAGGDHLLAGPGWNGETPAGIRGVFRADTFLVGCLGRTYLAGPQDTAELRLLQRQYRLRPLSEYLGVPAPPAPPQPAWPAWREEAVGTVDFLGFLDFLLGFFPVLPGQRDLRDRLAALGIAGRGDFDPHALAPAAKEAVRHGIADAKERLRSAKRWARGSQGLFGTREQLGDDYVKRSVAADHGIFGLPEEEAWYTGRHRDAEGRPADGSRCDYVLRFPPGRLPPARFFWSATMYRLPQRQLVANPVDRYSIGDRTPGLVLDPDGGLSLHLQRDEPGSPTARANWLPAPDGPFLVVVRVYGPHPDVLAGRWTMPPLTVRHVHSGG